MIRLNIFIVKLLGVFFIFMAVTLVGMSAVESYHLAKHSYQIPGSFTYINLVYVNVIEYTDLPLKFSNPRNQKGK